MKSIAELIECAKKYGVLVAGAGETGLAAANLFIAAGFNVGVVDEKEIAAKNFYGADLYENYATSSPLRLKEKPAFVVLSPGVNPRGAFGKRLSELELPILSELDLALPFIGMPQVAVTGTNGKTTVVSLIYEMLKTSGMQADFVGNIGKPFLSFVEPEMLSAKDNGRRNSQVLVAEVSSYQLETTSYIKPRVAVLLNVDDDHLERHGSLEAYFFAKARLFENQGEGDWAVLNADEWWYQQLEKSICEKKTHPKIFPFGVLREEFLKDGDGAFYCSKSNIIWFRAGESQEKYDMAASHFLGRHNKINLCAAIASARLAGASVEAVRQVLASFRPLKHRIQYVREFKKVHFVNDSKGTNVSSVVVALETMQEEFGAGKIVLLVGGKIKDGSWQPIRDRLLSHCRALIAFGGDREEVLRRLGFSLESDRYETLTIKSFPTMKEAVLAAAEVAKSEDIVLLSPGCASFDEFKNFAERGEVFCKLVNSL